MTSRTAPLLHVLPDKACELIRRHGDSGAYTLVIELTAPLHVTITGNPHRLAPGWYVYVGSARRNLTARVTRHLRANFLKSTASHWHIDRLTLSGVCRINTIGIHPGCDECAISHRIATLPGASVPIPGFGASDCSTGCPAHLYRVNTPARCLEFLGNT